MATSAASSWEILLDVLHRNKRRNGAHLSIIDELAVIPVAGRDIVSLDGDCSRPSSATAYARKGQRRDMLQKLS
jgi:hypothetical protein